MGKYANRISLYWLTGAGAVLAYSLLYGNRWRGSVGLHTLTETAAMLLALVVGVVALARYYHHRDSAFLFIGTGFLGTALLEGYHLVVAGTGLASQPPADLSPLIPANWTASRLFLAVLLWLSTLSWQHQQRSVITNVVSEKHVYASIALVIVAGFVFFVLMPISPARDPEPYISRSQKLMPSLFFALALAGYLGKGIWRHDPFDHWLVLALIMGLAGQAAYMPFPAQWVDMDFNAAYLLKNVSYAVVLSGLLINLALRYQHSHEARVALAEYVAGQQADSPNDGLVITDRQGAIQTFSPVAERMFGWRAADIIGRNVRTLIADDPAVEGGAHLAAYRVLGAGTAMGRNRDLFAVRADGNPFPVEVMLTSTVIGGQRRMLAAISDITTAKTSETALAERTRVLEGANMALRRECARLEEQGREFEVEAQALEQAIRLKSEFLTNTVHELRTPMNAIIGFNGQVLKKSGTLLPDRQHQNLLRVERNAYYLLGLINDLQDLSKIEAGMASIVVEDFRLADLFGEVDDLMRLQTEEKGLVLITGDAGEVPMLTTDRGKLKQVLINLLDNAIKFSATGDIRLEVQRLGRPPDHDDAFPGCGRDHVTLTITDHGAGMDALVLSRIFDAFHRADSATIGKTGGTGLGLTISKRLVELLEGRIEARSSQGEGSVFTVALPLVIGGRPTSAPPEAPNGGE